MLPAADLDALYDAADGFTVAATFGSETTQVHFREPDIVALGDRILADYTMRFRASTLTTLTRGSTVVIDGSSYKVIEVPTRTASGDERVARLSKV